MTSTDGRMDTTAVDAEVESAATTGDHGTNPEQLWRHGYAACSTSALKLVAGRQHVERRAEPAVSVTVDLISDGSGFGIGGKIEAELPGVDAQTGRQLIEAAHEVCPYSKATRGNIPVELVVVDG